jgi:phosphoribosylanthranilate isomerase
MHRTRIKICGVCRPEDAAAAAFSGADAIGMVFHPASPRCISVDQARQISAAVPAFVSVIGLFVDASLSEIRQIADQLPLSAIQLHGNEAPSLVSELHPTRVIKALRPDQRELRHWKSIRSGNLTGIILETPSTGVPGGSGVANDWDAIEKLKNAGAFEGLPPIILAGGLNPENVGDVVRRFAPFGVDVSSGVEITRGEKSPDKIKAFIKAVHKADHDLAPHKKHP